MNPLSPLKRLAANFLSSEIREVVNRAAAPLAQNEGLLKERIAELELALEDEGWRNLLTTGELEFSRDSLKKIERICTLMFIKNPIVARGVDVQALYIFARGINIQARDPRVNAVVQAFWDSASNRGALTSQQAMIAKEHKLAIKGNLFFVFFAAKDTGAVEVRTIPFADIEDILCNPDDAMEPWYYKRSWNQTTLDLASGNQKNETRIEYYPDHRYNPASKPQTIGGKPVNWDSPILHIKVGALEEMKFGIPEVYRAVDWARAYKEFLEDWATFERALRRFAWKEKVPGGQRGVVNAKQKLGTTLAQGFGADTVIEHNPPSVVASTFIGTKDVELEPMKVSGSQDSPDAARRIFLMIAAAFGLPETFFGDVSVGNLATATAMDRPTEIKFLCRQAMWLDIFRQILDYVIDKAATAPAGPLRNITLGTPPAEGDETEIGRAGRTEIVDRYVDVSAPPILDHVVLDSVKAIVAAATLNGPGTMAGTIDPKTVTSLLLRELSVPEADEVLEAIFPSESYDAGEATRAIIAANQISPRGPITGPVGDPSPPDDRSAFADEIPWPSNESKRYTEALVAVREATQAFLGKYMPKQNGVSK